MRPAGTKPRTTTAKASPPARPIADNDAAAPWRGRVDASDWDAVRTDLDGYGCALTGPLLSRQEARDIAALYADDSRFRSTVDMGRYRFGAGEYRYFAEPFPDAVLALKQALHMCHGGEFLLYEQRPRAQSRGTATLIPHGHGLVFTTRDRPVESQRGWSAAPVRHGVSVVRSGQRFALGLVFHDAA